MRVGIGFDVHKFVSGRPLILGGVEIPHPLGLEGYSDADVIIHAIMDALLGALNRGDIGRVFPDTREKFRGISSLTLLKEVKEILKKEKTVPINIDVVVILEEPRLEKYWDKMRENISYPLDIDINRVSLKATTTEGLGFCGRKEGIAAQAVALVEEKKEGNVR